MVMAVNHLVMGGNHLVMAASHMVDHLHQLWVSEVKYQLEGTV